MGFRDHGRPEELIQVEEAQARVLECVSLLDVERVSLDDALGRVLREEVVAHRDVPAADNSAMDGYAVRSADIARATRETPAVLNVIDDVPAGSISSVVVQEGTAIRIMTGAPVPQGADAVVQVEETDAGSERVAIFKALPAGANVRRAGEDVRKGDRVVGAGTLLRSGEIGVLAMMQRARVDVGRRPTVAVLSTGDEIVDIEGELTPGKIVNSNAWSLASLVRECGAIPRVAGIVPDRRDATVAAIRDALDADIIISSGGVSAGAFDFVSEALEEAGFEPRFAKVAMKPGKPVVFATRGKTLYFGLPGNPVSCMVGFILFVAPAIRKAMGQGSDLLPPRVTTTLTGRVGGGGDRRTYVRVRVTAAEDGLVAAPMRAQGSGVSTSMVGANGLAILEKGKKSAEAGERLVTLIVGPLASGV